jgi:hypothetical protein
MADLGQILQIITLVRDIIAALKEMGLKVDGTVNIPDLVKLIPR